MTKKTIKPKRLQLETSTLRDLLRDDYRRVAAGMRAVTSQMINTCTSCKCQ
jgi:hypothetical protein